MHDDLGNAASPETGREVGEGVGGVAGIAAGAALGSLAGPVGTVIGAIAGAVGGWWAGKEVADATTNYTEATDTQYRSHFDAMPRESRGRFSSYDQARPLYQFGHVAAQNPDYRGRSFDQVEPELKRGWNQDMERQYGSWNDVRGTLSNAYGAARDAHVTRSEEELVVGKRQVQGEAGVRKTVETEHVTKSVPLMHEEVTIERHAVNADSTDVSDAQIGERDIRIPLTAEEAVVQKRVVGKEEVIIGKHAVEETRNVEADLRRERIDIDRKGRAGADSDVNSADQHRADNPGSMDNRDR